jgi:hypothetical protein
MLKKNHSHHGLFIQKAATMALQDLQEMQASTGSVLSSGFIHFTVLAEKSATNVHIMNKVSPPIFSCVFVARVSF